MRFLHEIRRAWHNLVCYVFQSHIRDEITEMIHPEFGLIWEPGDVGWEIVSSAEFKSYREGYLEGYADALIQNRPKYVEV